ncbi:MAG TPA: DUF1854 domain-containing protein [Pirellulales bacterium]|jgi:hypothetical protein
MATDKDEGSRAAQLAGISLQYDSFGRLVLIDSNGRRHVGVEPIRAFPLSDAQRGISICNVEGVEVLWIDDLQTMPAASRKMVEEELGRREFMPVIERIVSVSSNADPSRWEVDTDRGRTEFLLKSEDDVRRVGPRGAILLDSAGMRYIVPDTKKLDSASRRVLERYL